MNIGYHNPENNNQEYFDYEGDLTNKQILNRLNFNELTNNIGHTFLPKNKYGQDIIYQHSKRKYTDKSDYFKSKNKNQIFEISKIAHSNAIFIDYKIRELHHWRPYEEYNLNVKKILSYICNKRGLNLKQHTNSKQKRSDNCVIFSFWYLIMKTLGYSFNDIEKSDFNDERSAILIENMKKSFKVFEDKNQKYENLGDDLYSTYKVFEDTNYEYDDVGIYKAYYIYCMSLGLKPILSNLELTNLMDLHEVNDVIEEDQFNMEEDRDRNKTQTLFFFNIKYYENFIIDDIFSTGYRSSYDNYNINKYGKDRAHKLSIKLETEMLLKDLRIKEEMLFIKKEELDEELDKQEIRDIDDEMSKIEHTINELRIILSKVDDI